VIERAIENDLGEQTRRRRRRWLEVVEQVVLGRFGHGHVSRTAR
jgi:hypothetical protein